MQILCPKETPTSTDPGDRKKMDEPIPGGMPVFPISSLSGYNDRIPFSGSSMLGGAVLLLSANDL